MCFDALTVPDNLFLDNKTINVFRYREFERNVARR